MDFSGKTCPVCSENFQEGDDIVVCPKCGAPYHRECYKEKGKCIYPKLHKEHKTWKEVYDKSDTAAEPTSVPDSSTDHDDDKTICPFCGEENDEDAIVCSNCGNMLTNHFIDIDADEGGMPDGFKYLEGSNPFSFFIDPMGGVSKNEDFDGVTGAELARLVQRNTPYYLPVFKRIKDNDRSRFNFMAFIFTGGWYLFRKQYLKGTVITVLSFLLNLVDTFIQYYYSNALWKKAAEALADDSMNYVSLGDYLSWMFQNCYDYEIWLMLAPYAISFISWFIMFMCGFTANRSYFAHCVKKIKKIKQTANSEEIFDQLRETGGINVPIAWLLVVCNIIVMLSTLFI